MVKTETYWIWTEKAGRMAHERGIIGAKAGEPVMMRTRDDRIVKLREVPREWVEKGYVEEAAQEQTELF